jgi:hypothetical protein
MTHDELLLDINKEIDEKEFIPERYYPTRYLIALRSVVELHKPKEEDGKLWCRHEVCYNHVEFL